MLENIYVITKLIGTVRYNIFVDFLILLLIRLFLQNLDFDTFSDSCTMPSWLV